jgi:hypothetical protein
VDNRIRSVTWLDRSPAASGAEVWITVTPEHLTTATEVRGRLLGPRCPYAQTVEVAYPLRPLRRQGEGPTALTRRVVIPEASLWEPECPFVYEGAIELWQDDRCVDRLQVRHGLRTLALTPAGLRLNGRPLALHGGFARSGSGADALAWRRRGWNLLVVDVTVAAASIWDLADRFGFLVIGRLPDLAETTLTLSSNLATHPSSLGWLLPPGAPATLPAWRIGAVLVRGEAPPSGIAFVAGGAELASLGLPLLLLDGTPMPAPLAFGCVDAS